MEEFENAPPNSSAERRSVPSEWPFRKVNDVPLVFENRHSDGTPLAFGISHSDGTPLAFGISHSDGTPLAFGISHSDGTPLAFGISHSDGTASRVGRFLLRALWEIVSTVVPAILIALFINVYVAQATVIDGPSMQPNLHYDQQVMIEKVTYRFIHGPRRGDVVTFNLPDEEIALIKRVVALPGETVEVREGRVFIDGERIEEPWTRQFGGPDYPPTVVPPLHIFVLGDNRPVSRDSRYFGLVGLDQVTGHAWFICWPPDDIKLIR